MSDDLAHGTYEAPCAAVIRLDEGDVVHASTDYRLPFVPADQLSLEWEEYE